MIFVTVGGQLPFDRLIRTVDDWAGASSRSDVFAQVGAGEYLPTHFEYTRFLAPAEFKARLAEARVIVAHAGMGTIISSLELRKPIVILPRKAALGEQRNDHQLATARHFKGRGQVHVALDEAELMSLLERAQDLSAAPEIGERASEELLGAIRAFIAT